MSVPSRSAEELTERSAYFKHILDLQCGSSLFRLSPIEYHVSMPEILAHVYFCLTDAYKQKHLHIGHRTDLAKRAAIKAATIAYVAPLRPPPGVNIPPQDDSFEGSLYRYANPMLAMRAASSVVAHPFHKRPFDDRRRVFNALAGLKFASVDPILAEARTNEGLITSAWTINITPQEESNIGLLVDQFILYSMLKNAEQENR